MEITSAKTIKYLGITIDNHLKWDEHLNTLVKKLRSLLSKFKYLKQFFDIKYLEIMYYALVQSHLSYGIIGWGGVTNCYLSKLQIIQKWILKIIYNKYYTYPTDQLYAESKIFDLRQLFCHTILMNIYKNKNNLRNIGHEYSTRYKEKSTKVPKMNKTIGQRSFIYLGPKICNVLPKSLKEINSHSLFKSKTKMWVSQQPRNKIHQLIDMKNDYY